MMMTNSNAMEKLNRLRNPDYDPIPSFHVDDPAPIEVGGSFLDREAPATTEITDGELFRRFVDLVQRVPDFGYRAGAILGADSFKMPVERPDPMPRAGVTSIEASFGDRGQSKAKRQRKDQERARFDISLQVSTTTSRGVSSPTFRGRADFYDPTRALTKAQELTKATKSRTPFTAEYLAFVEQIVAAAQANDMLVGFLHTKPETGGTYYHDRQMVIASRSGLEAHKVTDAVILLDDPKGLVSFRLPPTTTTTSKGKPLASKFVVQSRGEAKPGLIGNSWAIGTFQMQKH